MINLYEIKSIKAEVSCMHDTSTRTVDIINRSVYYYLDEKCVFTANTIHINNVDEVIFKDNEWYKIIIRALNKEVLINQDGDVTI